MTDERLAEIRREHAGTWEDCQSLNHIGLVHDDLLPEISRLRILIQAQANEQLVNQDLRATVLALEADNDALRGILSDVDVAFGGNIDLDTPTRARLRKAWAVCLDRTPADSLASVRAEAVRVFVEFAAAENQGEIWPAYMRFAYADYEREQAAQEPAAEGAGA